MTEIFEATAIRNMPLQNRLIRSATWEGMCNPDGGPTGKLIDCYKALADGGVGLIITGYAFVRPDGRQLPGKMGIHTDDFAAGMEKLTASVHERAGKICIQLVHAGGQTDSKNAGRQPLAPSAIKVAQFPETPAAMTISDINEIIAAFAAGAERAKKWGFDAVQLHAAHGYLLCQFLSPLTNRRADDYGGTIENRCRFLLEVYRAVRKATGPNYPVFAKLNGSDFLEGGLSLDDALFAAKLLSVEGIDAIEVSGGTPASGEFRPVRVKIKTPAQEAYNLSLAKAIKKVVGCPIMTVGGFRSYQVVEKALQEEGMDYVSLSRPFIREPHLPRRWQEGDRSPARCISCNSCFTPGLKGEGIYCVIDKMEKEKARR